MPLPPCGPSPVPPPAPEQLDIPLITRSPNGTRRNTFLLRPHANGTSISPHASEYTPHPGDRDAEAVNACPVATETVTFPVELAGTVSLAGLKVHVEYAGRVPHLNVNIPDEPLAGVNTSV